MNATMIVVNILAAIAWLVAMVAVAAWRKAQARANAAEWRVREVEAECERVREVGLRTIDMWQAADRARAGGRSVNEALSPFLARPVPSPEPEASRR